MLPLRVILRTNLLMWPKAADPSPPGLDPEGSGTMDERPIPTFLDELGPVSKGTVPRLLDELQEELGAKIDKSQSEMLAQIAEHTALISHMTEGFDPKALTEAVEQRNQEMSKTSKRNSAKIEDRLSRIEKVYHHASEASRQASTLQHDAQSILKDVIRLKEGDWRVFAAVSLGGTTVGIIAGVFLGIEFWGTTSHWLDALTASSDRDGLCDKMGFGTYPQGEDQTVCATVYPNR